MENQPKPKFNLKFAFLLSFAVFAQEISFNFYDSQVPLILDNYITSIGVIGFIMGIDNLLGLFIEPLVGNLSDNTKTRWGRRMPYLIFGIPLSALFFVLIPFETSLLTLMIFILMYITTMLAFKAPAESLVPDFIVPEHRSKANAIVKTMTSISIIFAALISELLVDVNLKLSFAIPAIVMIIALIILVLNVKEKNSFINQEELKAKELGGNNELPREKVRFFKTLGDIFRQKDKSILFLLISVFLMAISWSSMRSLLSMYGVNAIHLTEGEAGGISLYGGIVFMLLAFLIAYLSEKINRLLFFRIGFILFIIGFILGFVIQTKLFLIISSCIIAVGYGFIGVNAVVILWNLAPNHKVSGTYTGIYYLFFYGAYSVGSMLVGFMTDLTGWTYMFINSGIFVTIGLVFAMLIKRETHLTEANQITI